MSSSNGPAKRDISTLPARGHFYFALTSRIRALTKGVIQIYYLARDRLLP